MKRIFKKFETIVLCSLIYISSVAILTIIVMETIQLVKFIVSFY